MGCSRSSLLVLLVFLDLVPIQRGYKKNRRRISNCRIETTSIRGRHGSSRTCYLYSTSNSDTIGNRRHIMRPKAILLLDPDMVKIEVGSFSPSFSGAELEFSCLSGVWPLKPKSPDL